MSQRKRSKNVKGGKERDEAGEVAEAHSGSAALESDKAGDGVPGYSSTTAYQGDFTQFFYLFCEKGKNPTLSWVWCA